MSNAKHLAARHGLSGALLGLAIGCTGIGTVHADQITNPSVLGRNVDLSAGPTATVSTVAPNVVLTFDDSTSMLANYMSDRQPYRDKDTAWWYTGYISNGSYNDGIAFDRLAAPYICAGVITPGVSDPADPRSWTMNGVYYNPDNTYAPPLKADGTSMPDIDYNHAPDDGLAAYNPAGGRTVAYFNLGSMTGGAHDFCGHTSAGYYKYTGSVPATDPATGRMTAGGVNTLYQDVVNPLTPLNFAHWTWVSVDQGAAQEKQNFANWFSYYRTRALAAATAVTRAFSPFGSNVRMAWQALSDVDAKPDGSGYYSYNDYRSYFSGGGTHWSMLTLDTPMRRFVDGDATANMRTRFYQWLFNMGPRGTHGSDFIAYTPNRAAAMNVGRYFSNRSGAVESNPYWDVDAGQELVCRQNYHIQMTDGLWNGEAPAQVIPHDKSSIGMLPDGIQSFTASGVESAVVWNEGANTIATMADIAFHYWARDLQAGVTGASLFATEANRRRVTPAITDLSTHLFGQPLAAGADPRTNAEIYWNPANDPATWPHLVQYLIGLGTIGVLPNNDSTYRKLRTGQVAWPVMASNGGNNPESPDDMWHAALNSRGAYFSATNPGVLVEALQKIIDNIVTRSLTMLASSLNASVLTSDTAAFQAGYDTYDWKGSLTANPVNTDGTVSPSILWDARVLLDERVGRGDSRVILTSTAPGAGHGVAFTGSAVVDAIHAVDPAFGAAAAGADRLAWWRGDRGKEDGATLRRRGSVLGAIINAQTLYVAQPDSGYRDDLWPAGSAEAHGAASGRSYARFRADHAKRAPTLYVAANDGMLHAFDATLPGTPASAVDVTPSPGAERWAYVPYAVYKRLASQSTGSDFEFLPTVDGTPVSRDVYFSGANEGWHTLLVAGLRLGGRGVYALDITESGASQDGGSGKAPGPAGKVLWEFHYSQPATSAGNPKNLGYTYGRPNIARLANDKWVVLVPVGYFPKRNYDREISGTPVASPYSSLFVLDAQTGELIRELRTPEPVGATATSIASYGLTTPVLGDYQGDQIDDVAFAGDLQGSVWRFDFTGRDPSEWKVEQFFQSGSAISERPIVLPGDRPITVMPRLIPDPVGGGFIVLFGTGKYLGREDNMVDASTMVQAVYGIRDLGQQGQATVIAGGAETPLVRHFLYETAGLRSLSDEPVPARAADGKVIRGWYFTLDIQANAIDYASARGERMVVDATPVPGTYQVILATLIPQTSDPCNPALSGAVMIIDAITGQGAWAAGINNYDVSNTVAGDLAGARLRNPPTGGSLPAAVVVGGGVAYVPGLIISAKHWPDLDGKAFSFNVPLWRRRAWRPLNDAQ
ncbi:pilus assembly protein [Dyella sedimenti]|uniref:pilus assembly protein n=1 Tax=Dyella sedimenti TaxID=2919947 RepID=UPI001FAA7F51|nr:PilC/PilY family type IV pilus protein [Dyella sedimenti]